MADSIGARLKAERKRLRLTPDGMALSGGVSRTTQFSYERNLTTPDCTYFQRLSTCGLEIDTGYIITGQRAREVAPELAATITQLIGATDSFSAVLDRMAINPDPATLETTVGYLRGALDSFRAALLRAQSQTTPRGDQ